MQNQTVSDDTHAKDRSRFKSMRDEGAAIDERIAMQISNYKPKDIVLDDDIAADDWECAPPVVWSGSLTKIRQDVAILAANPAMTAAAGDRCQDPESEDMQRLSALAVVRVNAMHTCLSLENSNALVGNAKFPTGLLIGLAAASLARMPIDDSYEAQYLPRFTELSPIELQAAIDQVASDPQPTEMFPTWVITLNGENLVIELNEFIALVSIQITGPDGKTPVTQNLLRGAAGGDGLCRFDYETIDHFGLSDDELDGDQEAEC